MALPQVFAVRTTFRNRTGFYLLNSMRRNPGGDIAEYTLQPCSHNNNFYTITNNNDTGQKVTVRTVKNYGTVVKDSHWRNDKGTLTHNGIVIPIIRFTPFNNLPSVNSVSFIPIIERNAVNENNAANPTIPLPVPEVAEPVQNKYQIKEIPQHAIRLILLGALIQEMDCPITTVNIDETNGAITSCFHIFERNAIATWLALPNSRDKCPVCSTPCNMFTLDT